MGHAFIFKVNLPNNRTCVSGTTDDGNQDKEY
jgi:hypothetical protein